jgi:hypothetical protein
MRYNYCSIRTAKRCWFFSMQRPNYIITPRHYCALTSQLFPDKVGRMVLDGAVDPSVSNYQQSPMWVIGFNTALNAFIAYNLTQRSCPLPIDKVAATQSIINLFGSTKYKPLVRKKKVKGDSREFPFFIQWLKTDHSSQDGQSHAKIEKIIIADEDQLANPWFKNEILSALEGVNVEWIDPSDSDGDNGILAVHLSTPNGVVVLD